MHPSEPNAFANYWDEKFILSTTSKLNRSIQTLNKMVGLGLGWGKSVYQLWTQLGADPFINRKVKKVNSKNSKNSELSIQVLVGVADWSRITTINNIDANLTLFLETNAYSRYVPF